MYELLVRISEKRVYWLIACLVVLQGFTVVFIKKAALSTLETNSIFQVIFNIFYIISMVFFVLRSVLWQIVLLKNPISKYYPMLSLNYILLLILGYYIFDEKISMYNIIGTVLIIFGVFQMSRK